MNRILPAILGATICLTLPAADSTGRISGKVTDRSGRPVANASIVLKRTSDVTWSKTLTSAQSGAFFMAGLAPKEFQVTVSAEGYAPQAVVLKIPLGETLTQNFTLLTTQEARSAEPATADPSVAKASVGAEAFNQAVAFYNEKNYVDALPLTEKAYKHLKEAHSLASAGRQAELAPQLAQVERVHGLVLFEVGKLDESRQKDLWAEAEGPLKAALTRNGKDQRALECLIEVSRSKGDAEGTRGYESALNALVGARPEVHFNQGVTAYNKGDMAGAKPFFQKTVQVDPKFAEAYYLLAMCEFAGNNLKATKHNFVKYLEVAPNGKHASEVKAMLSDPMLKSIK